MPLSDKMYLETVNLFLLFLNLVEVLTSIMKAREPSDKDIWLQ